MLLLKFLRVVLALFLLILLCVPFIQVHSDPVFEIDQQPGAAYQAPGDSLMDMQSNWNAFSMWIGLLLCLLINQLARGIPKQNVKRFFYSAVPLLKHADLLLPVKCKSYYMTDLLFILRNT